MRFLIVCARTACVWAVTATPLVCAALRLRIYARLTAVPAAPPAIVAVAHVRWWLTGGTKPPRVASTLILTGQCEQGRICAAGAHALPTPDPPATLEAPSQIVHLHHHRHALRKTGKRIR